MRGATITFRRHNEIQWRELEVILSSLSKRCRDCFFDGNSKRICLIASCIIVLIALEIERESLGKFHL